MDLEKAKEILSLGNEPFSAQDIFNAVKEDPNPQKLKLQARDVLLKTLVEQMVAELEKFHIQIEDPSKCPACLGTGNLYKFYKDVKRIPCRTCGGRGKLEHTCKKCGGSGKYYKSDKNLKLRLKCKYCNGTGTQETKCRSCFGKGYHLKFIIEPKVKTQIKCKRCSGLGFKNSKLQNPVMSPEVAKILVKK